MGKGKLMWTLFLCILLGACAQSDWFEEKVVRTEPMGNTAKLEFLTRDGCKSTPKMLINVEQALASMDSPLELNIVHQATLPPDDPRTGYPTPTILVNGSDIFGLPVPEPPFPAPA